MMFVLFAATATAGEFNQVLSVGDAAPTWKDLEGIDGKKHSFDDWKAKDVLVVVFTCNTCATSIDYEDRLIAFAEKLCKPDAKVGLVAINCNTVKDDLLPKMKERAQKKKFNFPYLHDPSQATAKAYGAKWTPEFFVLNRDRKVVYMGAMDDKTKAEQVKEKYVELGVEAALAGKAAAKGETAARGCRIRFVQPKD